MIEKSYLLAYGLRNPFRNLKSGKLSRLCPETSKKFYVHEFGFWDIPGLLDPFPKG